MGDIPVRMFSNLSNYLEVSSFSLILRLHHVNRDAGSRRETDEED